MKDFEGQTWHHSLWVYLHMAGLTGSERDRAMQKQIKEHGCRQSKPRFKRSWQHAFQRNSPNSDTECSDQLSLCPTPPTPTPQRASVKEREKVTFPPILPPLPQTIFAVSVPLTGNDVQGTSHTLKGLQGKMVDFYFDGISGKINK